MFKQQANAATTFSELDFREHPSGMGGKRAVTAYPNGYGASVIQSQFSYGGDRGLYELAVLRSGRLCYDTPITDDVLGHLSEKDVDGLLAEIASLAPADASA